MGVSGAPNPPKSEGERTAANAGEVRLGSIAANRGGATLLRACTFLPAEGSFCRKRALTKKRSKRIL